MFNLLIFSLGLFIFILVLTLPGFFYWFRKRRKKNIVPTMLQMVFFHVLVPKIFKNEDAPAQTPADIKNVLTVAENFFAAIGGLRAQRGVQKFLEGRDDHLAFEIVVNHNTISFYVGVPKFMKDYLIQTILAHYPEANIEAIRPYNLFSPFGKVAGCYLEQTREYIFPIKTYTTIDTDPLNNMMNNLGKVAEPGSAVIQFIVRSAKKEWHRWGYKTAQELQKGTKLQQAVDLSAPGFTFSKVVKMFSTSKPKKPHDLSSQKSLDERLTPMMQETIKKIEEKTSKAGLDVNIRIITCCQNEALARQSLHDIIESFNQFNLYQYGNKFKAATVRQEPLILSYTLRQYEPKHRLVLNAEEMASVFHFPTAFMDNAVIKTLPAKRMAAPLGLPPQGQLLGENVYQEKRTPIHILPEDRRRHMYVVGMTGTGKSTLMENMVIQDIAAGHGVCVIDPHGSLVENILNALPKERADDVVIFNASDTDRPLGLNILEATDPQAQDLAIQEMIAIFYKLVTDPSMIGPMFEHNMRNAMLTLMADQKNPGTIVDIPRLFTDPAFQKYKLKFVTNPIVLDFWEKEMSKTTDFHKSEMLGYLISKVGRFVENSLVRNIIGQSFSSFDLRKIMDEKKILLCNLSKGLIGEMNSSLLGLILVSKIQMAALSRADLSESARSDFYLYLDEFQNFITDSISIILAEARKYRLNLILAHQYLGQLTGSTGVEGKSGTSKVRDAIFGNVGTVVCFRIGVEDAEILAKQLGPGMNEYDLMNIEKYNAYLRLLVDNQALKSFNMQCFPPIVGDPKINSLVKSLSRLRYGRAVQIVESEILQKLRVGSDNPKL